MDTQKNDRNREIVNAEGAMLAAAVARFPEETQPALIYCLSPVFEEPGEVVEPR